MLLGDVVDQFHHVDGLADAGAAEQADLAALGERTHQVDHLDAGFQQLIGRALLFIGRRRAVDFPVVLGYDRAGFVDRIAEHVHDAAESAGADRNRDAASGVGGNQVALQAVGGTERDATHYAVAQLLLHFKRDFGIVHFQRVVHFWHFVAVELNVNHRADDLYNFALAHSEYPQKVKFCNSLMNALERLRPQPRRRRSRRFPG